MPNHILENTEGRFPVSYDFVNVTNVLNVPETYIQLATLTTPERGFGLYEFKLAINYKLNVASRSIFFRWRLDGGEFNEYISEPKDRTDSVPEVYFFPIRLQKGSHIVEYEIRKEDATGVLDVFFFDGILQRVGN